MTSVTSTEAAKKRVGWTVARSERGSRQWGSEGIRSPIYYNPTLNPSMAPGASPFSSKQAARRNKARAYLVACERGRFNMSRGGEWCGLKKCRRDAYDGQ